MELGRRGLGEENYRKEKIQRFEMKTNDFLQYDTTLEDDSEKEKEDSRSESPAFSYFSIASSKVETKSGLSTFFSCMKSSIRWKASLLNKKERKPKPVLTEDDIEFLTTTHKLF